MRRQDQIAEARKLLAHRQPDNGAGRWHLPQPGDRLHLSGPGRARARAVLRERAAQYRARRIAAARRELDDA